MDLVKVKYSQFEEDSRKWNLEEIQFGDINLLVGKNSSGKSKTIRIINSLSKILSENVKLMFSDGKYSAEFKSKSGSIYNLDLSYENNQVVNERLFIDNVEYLQRDPDGIGKIRNKNEVFNDFKIPTNEFIINRLDEFQYPYLEPLNNWAKHVRLFEFNTYLGKDRMGIRDKSKGYLESDFILKITDRVVDVYNKGFKKHGDNFKEKVIQDFNSIGFDITDIGIGSLISIGLEIIDNPNAEIIGLRVQEKDIGCITDQHDMSMGMFRALSIIIHLNYYEFENITGCILIDDIGEGLDFERSTSLIQLLIKKVGISKNKYQLIMSTNDRHIMNAVDLKYWQIIDRIGSNVKYYNSINSEKAFNDYLFTGLNNFDFFVTDFFKTGFVE